MLDALAYIPVRGAGEPLMGGHCHMVFHMSIDANELRRLAAHNLSVDELKDIILMAADSMEKEAFKTEERRAKARARTAKSRNKNKNRDVTATLQSCYNDKEKEVSPHTPLQEKEKTKEIKENPLRGVKEKKKGTRLEATFEPRAKDLAVMEAELRLGREVLLKETKTFIDYWIARAGAGGVKLDWNATWRNWMRKSLQNGAGKFAGPGPPSNWLAEATKEAERKLGIDPTNNIIELDF